MKQTYIIRAVFIGASFDELQGKYTLYLFEGKVENADCYLHDFRIAFPLILRMIDIPT